MQLRFRTAGGSSAGADTPMKFSASRYGRPASITVGISGATCERAREVTASGRSFSALICGTFCWQRVQGEAQPAGDQVGDHRRAALISDVLDVETQLLLKVSPRICPIEPTPPEPKKTFLFCALIQLMSSAKSLAGTDGWAITTSGTGCDRG